jgi:hypothetical protein
VGTGNNKHLTPYGHVYDHHLSSIYTSQEFPYVVTYVYRKAQDGAQSNVNVNGMSGDAKHYDHATPWSGDMVGARTKWG